jgi:hypothetical protein
MRLSSAAVPRLPVARQAPFLANSKHLILPQPCPSPNPA